ncbi:MAG: hypothetical protein ACLGG7_11620 [Bacteriovoracia bacterium]
MSRFFALTLLFILLAGCTTVLDKLNLSAEIPRRTVDLNQGMTVCSHTAQRSPQLVGSNPKAQKRFSELLRTLEPENLDFVEKAVLWSLLQTNIRPDLASPTARFQFVIHHNAPSRYRDFTGDEQGGYPFFEGLADLLKTHPKKRPLSYYAGLLDRHFTGTIVAGKQLEQSLRDLKPQLAADPKLRQHFFRGDELIRESERLTKIQFQKLVSDWQKVRRATPVNDTLFSYRKTPQLDVQCNYDFTLYDNSIFLIDKDENVGHTYGLTQGENSFLAVVSQRTPEPRALFGTPILSGNAKVRSSAMCLIRTPDRETWVVANQSRDPGQHLYHLFRYGLTKIKNPDDFRKLISHSRHMFLSDPLRLVIESGRSREEQIQELLKLNIPIYNAEAIGNIWGWSNIQNEGGRFYIDDRNPGSLFCAQ